MNSFMAPMPAAPRREGPRRFLDPADAVSEALFGLIMVLTFTCSISATEAGRTDIHLMLFGALGCNLAWGLIDAIMYIMGCLAERARATSVLLSVHRSGPQEAEDAILRALPPEIRSVLQQSELERIRQVLSRLPEPPERPGLGKEDWLGAMAVFLWVFLITFPVVIPFVIFTDVPVALRLSNTIAIILLFLAGFAFGRNAGLRPLRTGVAMVFLGTCLVAVTIALGG